ncbi:MAG: PolC-type DNA polymerase III [Lachnospiraceae bacterium]|nr:PolC-type DNA polymerase III [Lachnospiraceae bacterium]
MSSKKPFFEVFSSYDPQSQEIREMLSEVTISEVSMTSTGSRIDVYIESPHPVHKKDIFSVQKELAGSLDGRGRVKVTLHERFTLSSQYNAFNFFDEYKGSIGYAMKAEHPMMYSIYHQAKKEFKNDKELLITLPDSVIARDVAHDLQDYLFEVFNGTAGLDCNITIDYEQAEISPERLAAENRIRQEIAAISDRMAKAKENASEAVASKKSAGSRGERKRAGQSSGASKDRGHYGKKASVSDDPDMIYKKYIQGPVIPIAEIDEVSGDVTVKGEVISYEDKEVKDGTLLMMKFTITDYTDTIGVRIFPPVEEGKKLREFIAPHKFLVVCGSLAIGKYEHEPSISMVRGIKKIEDFRVKRQDNAVKKRVELHCHTKMSNMDAVDDVEKVIKTAAGWGWSAIAITDHGSVQGFPPADHTEVADPGFKKIYGMEAYVVDDMKNAVDVSGDCDTSVPCRLDDTFCVFDIETTGFSPVHNRIIEIGAVIVQDGKIVDSFDEFVNPECPIPYRITKLTTITDSMVKDADTIDKVLPRFLEFSRGAVMVGHNVTFDISFIAENAKRLGIPFGRVYADTLILSRILLPRLGRYTLDRVAHELGVSLTQHHRAVDDATATGGIWVRLCELMKEEGIGELAEVHEKLSMPASALAHIMPFHVSILAKNETGRVNLYRLVSMSHVKYFGGTYEKVPRIPKSELIAHREGLLLGSACERGELYRALIEDRPEQDIANIVSFYDYLEIQPSSNYLSLIDRDNDISSVEDINEINKKICELGEQWNKPVCATGDVHFIDPEDEIYRRIIKFKPDDKRSFEHPPLYLRTTDEMLAEFQYLGSDKAREVVIENTNLIADMIDRIRPVRPDKCPPVIERSDETLREICTKKAHELYGETLPEVVQDRMDTELRSIIGNGYAVMYIIAQKLVWKSNEDGYLVGSRGSVGSSFAAYLAGITEVNSLRPHYLCPKCRYSDFTSDTVMKAHQNNECGIDLPDAVCPECGEKLQKLGFDIPFETFLGFKGDKEPDIDLNFSSDYQSKSHKYTEVIFGSGYAFRAGTIETLAEKTAFGYTKKYYEEQHMNVRAAELDRIASGCTGVLRTTGQHPGGIIVLPHGEEIDTFTPIQHPADKMEDPTITTHFDFHSIDHNLLKLDNLGHQDPEMIKFLQDVTGVDPRTIPLDDKKVMQLFKDTSSLGIKSSDIGGTPNGSMGLPEFGTDNAIRMVMEAKPENFTDLVRISGLAHGTDVWAGNAEDLINSGTATLSTCICCRDDIMLYLIGMGMDSQMSFKIMENVRKGKIAKGKCEEWGDWKQEMTSHGVPDWYIKSCETIKYMFPKAHAAAYVMMAYRIAWFKVYMPLAYYCGYFSVRAKGFSYENCCQGPDMLSELIADYRRRENDLKDNEVKELKDMRIVQEMYARGIEFCPIDLNRVQARHFQIVDGKIMPSLSSITAIGPKAADAMITKISMSADKGPFLSRDDFCARSGASPAMADKLTELGILDEMPESNQLSLFDL